MGVGGMDDTQQLRIICGIAFCMSNMFLALSFCAQVSSGHCHLVPFMTQKSLPVVTEFSSWITNLESSGSSGDVLLP